MRWLLGVVGASLGTTRAQGGAQPPENQGGPSGNAALAETPGARVQGANLASAGVRGAAPLQWWRGWWKLSRQLMLPPAQRSGGVN